MGLGFCYSQPDVVSCISDLLAVFSMTELVSQAVLMYLGLMGIARTCLDLLLEVLYFVVALIDFIFQLLDDTALPRQQILQRAGRAFKIALVYYTGIVEGLERLRGRVRCILKRIGILYFTFGNRQNAVLQLLQLVGVGLILVVLLVVLVNPYQKLTVVRIVDTPTGILSGGHNGQYFVGFP